MTDAHARVPDEDELDGCEIDFSATLADPDEPARAVPDDELAYVALFAGVPEDEIEQVAAGYRELFGGVAQ